MKRTKIFALHRLLQGLGHYKVGNVILLLKGDGCCSCKMSINYHIHNLAQVFSMILTVKKEQICHKLIQAVYFYIAWEGLRASVNVPGVGPIGSHIRSLNPQQAAG